MTLYVIHYPGAYGGAESRDSWEDPEDAERALTGLIARGRAPLAMYAWTGPTESTCGRCGQEVNLKLGEWRNQFGFPTCPQGSAYPYRHEPVRVQPVPACRRLPDWWELIEKGCEP